MPPLHWNWKLKLLLLLLGFGLAGLWVGGAQPFSPRPASQARPKGGHLLSDGDSAVAQCDSKFGTQVVQTATSPSFKMAVAGYPADMVSQWLGDFGLWDVHVLGVISHALARAPPGDDEVMVDAGANLGFFGLFAAHSGFPAVAFEMQPRLHRVINTSLCLAEDSKFPYRLVPRPISDVEIELLVAEPQNSSTNLGGLGLEAFSCDPNDGGTVDLTGCTKTKTVRIDAIIKAPTKIRIIKVSTPKSACCCCRPGDMLGARTPSDSAACVAKLQMGLTSGCRSCVGALIGVTVRVLWTQGLSTP